MILDELMVSSKSGLESISSAILSYHQSYCDLISTGNQISLFLVYFYFHLKVTVRLKLYLLLLLNVLN